MAKEKGEYDVVILNRDKVTTYPKLKEPAVTVLVTYVGAGLPPFTLHIPEDEYSEDEERTLIRNSLEKRLDEKKETIRV